MPVDPPYPGAPMVGRYDPDSIYKLQEVEMLRRIERELNEWLNAEAERRGYGD